MRSIGWLVVLVLVSSFAALARWLGWLEGVPLADLVMACAGLVGLYVVVRYPWDLYMEARALRAEQRESLRIGIDVPEPDQASAAKLARNLLLVCVGIHVVSAGVMLLVSALLGGRVLGYGFAAAFVLATLLRPAHTLYLHLKARLLRLRERATHPREDVVSLRVRVDALEHDRRLAQDERAGLSADLDRSRADAERERMRIESDARRRAGDLDAKLDRVLGEVERQVDRMTDDRELVAGLRALLKMARSA